MKNEEMAHGEIIIVRRSGGHEEEHHGGVWKIAFADFMTAMMAFFLVMWLINSSSEQTKKAVASYFNPIKLMDTTTNPKGIKSPKYSDVSKEEEDSEATETTVISANSKAEKKSGDDQRAFEEQALFADPYALLSEIAGERANIDAKSAQQDIQQDTGKGGPGVNEGTKFQDPFDPTSWSIQFGAPKEMANLAADENKEGEELFSAAEGEPNKTPSTEEEASMKSQVTSDAMDKNSSDKAVGEEKTNEGKFAALKADIEKQTKSDAEDSIDVEVVMVDEGAVIVVADKGKSGMFNIASARPTPELVRAVAKIGNILGKRSGKIEIGGHTDARKYTSGNYDNWRLSTARAHMAYHMLLRGGLPEVRVARIAGFSSTDLKNEKEPFAAENRRIEILVLN